MNASFQTILCVDGSANKPSKRPVFRVDTMNAQGISRYRHEKGVAAIAESEEWRRLPKPILITVDVPIGLPNAFEDVWRDYRGFLPWLRQREGRDWRELVAESIGDQEAKRPFVVCKKGERKADGHFPLRRCERLTQGESVYWCVGGKQVGKAALQFWHDTLLPLSRHFGSRLAVWPFEALEGKEVVIAECYPTILYQQVWGRRVTKSSACDVVDAVDEKRQHKPRLCCDKTWLHAASSEDDFDMFTTAIAVAEAEGNPEMLFAAPDDARPVEGWMLLLPDLRM